MHLELGADEVLTFAACGVTRPCCLRSPALDLLFLSTVGGHGVCVQLVSHVSSAWMWSVRHTFRPTTRPRLFLAFVLHVLASSFCSTLGNGWSGRPLHPFSAQSLPRTGQRPVLGVHHLVHLVCVAFSGPRLPCNTVRACVLSQLVFAVLCCLSFGKAQQTGTEKAWIHRGRAMQRFSWRLSALGGGIASLLVHSGFDPTVFLFISLPHVSHASVGRLENGVSPQGPALGPLPHREISASVSELFQYPWHSTVMLPSLLCGHQAVAGLTPRWNQVCFGLQQCQTNEI